VFVDREDKGVFFPSRGKRDAFFLPVFRSERLLLQTLVRQDLAWSLPARGWQRRTLVAFNAGTGGSASGQAGSQWRGLEVMLQAGGPSAVGRNRELWGQRININGKGVKQNEFECSECQ
jgi:hypothetical protein